MPTTISFLSDPKYGKSVIHFILSPAGVPVDTDEIGKNLYGKREFDIESITIPGLSPRNGFRFSEIHVHWTDFLEISFTHADHVLFFVPDKQKYQETTKESIQQRNPDLYSFWFYRITCETYVAEEPEIADIADRLQAVQDALKSLNDAGWSNNAVTIYSIKGGKQSTVSDRVLMES